MRIQQQQAVQRRKARHIGRHNQETTALSRRCKAGMDTAHLSRRMIIIHGEVYRHTGKRRADLIRLMPQNHSHIRIGNGRKGLCGAPDKRHAADLEQQLVGHTHPAGLTRRQQDDLPISHARPPRGSCCGEYGQSRP